jgi:glycosyltransferase involved in cell wall biosynthesis
VDDGSTDGTSAAVSAVARSEPRLRLIAQPHRGIVAALNTGVGAARAGLIARMDADDEAFPERLAEQFAWLVAHPSVGVVSCLVEYGGDPQANAGYALHVDWINALRTPEEIAVNRFVEAPIAHPTVLFRRELIDRFGGYADGEFPEDYELWLRWLGRGVSIAKVPRPLLRWNDPPARLSRIDPRYAPEAFFRVKAPWIAAEVARAAQGRAVWIWGAGRPTRRRAAPLAEHGVPIAGYIDIDPKKTTSALGGRGLPVIAPAELPSPAAAFVLGYVGNRGARELIHGALTSSGYAVGRDYLPCA